MKLGVLFSGGKDSCYAAYLAKKHGHEVSCLISVVSENKFSYMFHTPSISKVEKQAEMMELPLIVINTKGEKEKELLDLKKGIKKAVDKYGIEGIISGAVESVYQATRVQKICNSLGIECFNPLWQKDQIELLEELILSKFDVIIVGVMAYPLDLKWLGRKIDNRFLKDVKGLRDKYGISPSGEGGEFESFVLDSPLFKKKLEVKGFKDVGEKNTWHREIEVK